MELVKLVKDVPKNYSKDPLWIITAYDRSLNPEEWDENFVKRRTKP
jgi:hypothetical protein